METQAFLDPLYVGLTRQPLKMGVPWKVYLVTIAFCPLLFMWTQDFVLPAVLAAGIIGGARGLCSKDEYAIDILLLRLSSLRTMPMASKRYWGARCYAPE